VSIQNPFATQYFPLDGRSATPAVSFIELQICKPIHNSTVYITIVYTPSIRIGTQKPEPSVQGENPKESNMTEAKSSTMESSTVVAARPSNGGFSRSSSFKYYIHDSVSSCRLQLLGELGKADLAELDGCWRTIRTTLGARRLVLDLRRLKSADAASTRWLRDMEQERATYLPASYFDGALEPPPAGGEKPKLSPFARVLGLLRGACTASVD
jgi:hypothetical protein